MPVMPLRACSRSMTDSVRTMPSCSADHGGHDRTHGTTMPEDMTILLFFMGKQFEQGKVLTGASIKDVAPTVARLPDAEPAEDREGKSVI